VCGRPEKAKTNWASEDILKQILIWKAKKSIILLSILAQQNAYLKRAGKLSTAGSKTKKGTTLQTKNTKTTVHSPLHRGRESIEIRGRKLGQEADKTPGNGRTTSRLQNQLKTRERRQQWERKDGVLKPTKGKLRRGVQSRFYRKKRGGHAHKRQNTATQRS